MSCRTGHCAWGGHFVARIPVWVDDGLGSSRCSEVLTPAIGQAVMCGLQRPVYTPLSGRTSRRRPVR